MMTDSNRCSSQPTRVRLMCFVAGMGLSLWSLSGLPATVNSTSLAAEPATGSVIGRVIYTADAKRPWSLGRYYIQRKTGYLAEAVVCLEKVAAGPAGVPAKVTIDQKDFRFVPETTAIRVGDELLFTNSDPQVHNVNTNSGLQDFDISVGPGGETSVVSKRAGGTRRPLILGCKFHSVMKAWIYVFDHSCFQVTGTDGTFRLSGVPPGEYRLQMVHPAGGLEWSRLVRVTAGDATEQDIRVSPDDKTRGG